LRNQTVNSSTKIQRKLEAELELLSPGERIPSVRDLVTKHGVSPVTVSAALSQLSRSGRIITRPGNGSFKATPPLNTAITSDLSWQSVTLGARGRVSEELQTLLSPPRAGAIPLGSGYPDETIQPIKELERAALRASKRPGVWGRAPREGLEPLRAWFAAQLGGDTRADDVIIAPGGQAAVSNVLRALVPPGGVVAVESPTYFGALAALEAAELKAVPVPVDAHGIRTDYLEAVLEGSGAKVIYVQPLFQNPTGATLSLERRTELLKLAARHGAFIIEDDYARDFTLDAQGMPPPLYGLEPGRIVYIRSLSKSAAPSLRVAGVIARGAVFERLRVARSVDDLFVSMQIQEIALELVTSSAWARHQKHLREHLISRRDTALSALAQHFPEAQVNAVPGGGFGLWVQIPHGDLEFSRAAASIGVQIHAGRAWFPAEAPGAFLRLSFAGATESQLKSGIEKLGALWRSEFAKK
jgi:DNA-binding transcriptional MocR family regulator